MPYHRPPPPKSLIYLIFLVSFITVTGLLSLLVYKTLPSRMAVLTSPTPDIARAWNKYSSPKFGFSLAYPPGFTYREQKLDPYQKTSLLVEFFDGQYTTAEYNYPTLAVVLSATPLPPQDWVSQNSTTASGTEDIPLTDQSHELLYMGFSKPDTVTVASRSAYRFHTLNVSTGAVHTLFPLNAAHLIDISNRITATGEIPNTVYQQLLDSFQPQP